MVDQQHKSDSHAPLETHILKIDGSYRIRLPQPYIHKIGWIKGDMSISAWLLMGSPGRCRLHSSSEVDNDPNFRSLRERISGELNTHIANPLEFHDKTSAVLGLRLLPVEVTPPAPGWRLIIPRPMAAIMQLHPKQSELAAILLDGHIEFWTIDEVKSAVSLELIDV